MRRTNSITRMATDLHNGRTPGNGRAATVHDRLVTALLAKGCTVVGTRGGKYTEMTCIPSTLRADRDERYFIGAAGALRVGRSPTNSAGITEEGKARILGTTSPAA